MKPWLIDNWKRVHGQFYLVKHYYASSDTFKWNNNLQNTLNKLLNWIHAHNSMQEHYSQENSVDRAQSLVLSTRAPYWA